MALKIDLLLQKTYTMSTVTRTPTPPAVATPTTTPTTIPATAPADSPESSSSSLSSVVLVAEVGSGVEVVVVGDALVIVAETAILSADMVDVVIGTAVDADTVTTELDSTAIEKFTKQLKVYSYVMHTDRWFGLGVEGDRRG